MDFSVLLPALPEIRNWLTTLMDRRRSLRIEGSEIDERREAAVAALYIALNKTQIYLGAMRRDEAQLGVVTRNFETEATLSRLWNDASLKLRN